MPAHVSTQITIFFALELQKLLMDSGRLFQGEVIWDSLGRLWEDTNHEHGALPEP